jgi:hypothetical protein
LVDGSEVAVVRVVVTGVVATAVGATTKVDEVGSPGKVAVWFTDAAAVVVEVQLTFASPVVIL